jgi:hypothetical protein
VTRWAGWLPSDHVAFIEVTLPTIWSRTGLAVLSICQARASIVVVPGVSSTAESSSCGPMRVAVSVALYEA